jgi:hypothetical protein
MQQNIHFAALCLIFTVSIPDSMSATSESYTILTSRLCWQTFDQIESLGSCLLPNMSSRVAGYVRVVPSDD